MRKFINIAALFLLLPATAFGLEEDEYYCIQVASSPGNLDLLIEEAKELQNQFPQVRVEKIGHMYTVRVGFWKDFKKAKSALSEVKQLFPSAFLRDCYYKPQRWVFPARTETEKRANKIETRETATEKGIPEKPGKPSTSPLSFKWEEEFEKVKSQIKVTEPKLPQPLKQPTEEEKRVETASSKTTTFIGETYLFVDGSFVEGLDPRTGCRKRGRELIGRLGYRFVTDLFNSFSVWGDIYGGLGYQRFRHTTRRKGWWDIRYLYLNTRTFEERNTPGYDLSLGRMPLLEPRGFWYRNYLDGLRLRYQSTLLNWYLFAGGRFNDSRVSSSEERINLQGYRYLVARADYQYYYRQHLGFFFIKEYKKRFSNLNDPSVWKGVRPKENLNWLGVRLKGEKEWGSYWLDLGYMWGKRGFTDSIEQDCTAYKVVTATYYKGVHGIGAEIGAKRLLGDERNKGVGFRFAVGQGSNSRTGSTNFYLPKISTSMSYLFGPNRIRYYGELANPDLNNLVLLSLFGGYKVGEDTWLEANLIKYLQYKISPYAPFSRYFIAPNGKSRDLGTELDLLIDGEITGNGRWRYVAAGTLFIPGGAYSGKLDQWNAYGVFLRIKRYW